MLLSPRLQQQQRGLNTPQFAQNMSAGAQQQHQQSAVPLPAAPSSSLVVHDMNRSSISIRSHVSTLVNDSIVRMKTTGQLRVLKRDRAMERPPPDLDTTAAVSKWVTGLAQKWSDAQQQQLAGTATPSEAFGGAQSNSNATSPSSTSTTTTKKGTSADTTSMAAVPVLELPPSLVELYASMATNGISFIGRYESMNTAFIDKLFPSYSINACGAQKINPFAVSSPTATPPPPTSALPSSSSSSSSSSFTPVCMCHFNAIDKIQPVRVRMYLSKSAAAVAADVVGVDVDAGIKDIEGPSVVASSSAYSTSSSSFAFVKPKDAAPLDASDRFFILWSGSEGSAPAHGYCTGGDGTGIDIFLRYSARQDVHEQEQEQEQQSNADDTLKKKINEPEIWGYVPPLQQQTNTTHRNEEKRSIDKNGTLFYISKTFADFLRIGCLRYCWARLWPVLMAPAHVREAFGLGDELAVRLSGDGGGAEVTSTMRPWLEVFTGAPLRVSTAGLVLNYVVATVERK